MEDTSVEDFQDYHDHQPVGDIDGTTISARSSPGYMSKDNDCDIEVDEASFSGSAHQSSGPDEAVFDMPSQRSSPRTSHGSDDDISLLDSSYDLQERTSSPFTPLKTRSPFRNPSSVRAMQTDTTPPRLSTPSLQQPRKLYTPSRQGTPRSTRSHHSAVCTPTKLSPNKKLKKEYPLVLLHVTLLPIPLDYSPELLEAVVPPSVLENWKLIRKKATSTVLERGVLIPHPREDYDLLEERLLESLELKQPRILKCGHFHLSPEEEADVVADLEEDDDEELHDADICADCGRRIRDGRFGDTGTGSKRWDIKLFAANGLMRAGAWSAAWKEMERVDVEILPWMDEDMRRELDFRRAEEERDKKEQSRVEGEEGVGGLDDERLREIYGGDAQAYVDGLSKEPSDMNAPRPGTGHQDKTFLQEEVPLWDLLKNYLYVAAQDRRNIAIFLLSAIVLLLAMASFGSRPRHISAGISNDEAQTPAIGFADQLTSSLKGLSPSFSSTGPSAASATSDSISIPSPSPESQDREADSQTFLVETPEDVGQEMLED